MSQEQFILKLIGIKDKNVHLEEKFFTLEDLPLGGKLISHKIIKAYLQAPHNPPCPKCQAPTVKWGKKPPTSVFPKSQDTPLFFALAKRVIAVPLVKAPTP